MVVASTLSTSSEPDHPKESTISRLLRPLRDFGFGRTSAWEGGVGLFIFAGIGQPRLQPLHALRSQPSLYISSECRLCARPDQLGTRGRAGEAREGL